MKLNPDLKVDHIQLRFNKLQSDLPLRRAIIAYIFRSRVFMFPFFDSLQPFFSRRVHPAADVVAADPSEPRVARLGVSEHL